MIYFTSLLPTLKTESILGSLRLSGISVFWIEEAYPKLTFNLLSFLKVRGSITIQSQLKEE